MEKEERVIEEPQPNSEPVSEKKEKENEEEEGGCVGAIIFLIVVAAAIWALVHFNPSKEDHQEKINEALSEQVVDMYSDGYVPDYRQIGKLSKAKYHSLGICSWTTIRQGGKPVITSVGILGWVCPLF
ncbi:MAG: hypothetical protein K2G09_00615 [Paramuribaculum sp.]|nr:hypothetical protein [Paramuribaculum sp.]